MADAKPTFGRGVLLHSFLALAGFTVLGLFFSTFLVDARILFLGLAAATVAFVLGRVLAYLDRPRGHGMFARHLLTGVALGFGGWALLRGMFVEGPAIWALLGGFGFGLTRGHRALLKRAREEDDGRRWLRIFHPKDVQALTVLLAGYALVGLCGFAVLRAFVGFLPGGGQMLAIAAAAYALHGARLLLAFAAEERGSKEAGFVGWMKAHALQNAIVVLVLVAYAVFRDRLAAAVPFFPLIEFGLGVAVFGFVLARLRAKIRKDGSLLATSSEARDHERVVSELREADYDTVARPVTRFIESGVGKEEYAQALVLSLAQEDERAAELRAKVLSHREPPRPPALEIEWGFAAGATMAIGLAIAAFAMGMLLLDAPMPYPLLLALLFTAFGAYALQDVARAHHRPWLSLGVAAGGTFLLFLDFLFFAGSAASLAEVPSFVWAIVGAVSLVMIGIPAYSAWRLDQRLRSGAVVDAKRLAPALELQKQLQATRKRAATMSLAAFILLLPVPWLAGWLGERGIIPSEFPPFLDKLLAIAIWVVAAFGAAALVRFYGLTRGRAKLLAREKEKRNDRLKLHRTIMQNIERS